MREESLQWHPSLCRKWWRYVVACAFCTTVASAAVCTQPPRHSLLPSKRSLAVLAFVCLVGMVGFILLLVPLDDLHDRAVGHVRTWATYILYIAGALLLWYGSC